MNSFSKLQSSTLCLVLTNWFSSEMKLVDEYSSFAKIKRLSFVPPLTEICFVDRSIYLKRASLWSRVWLVRNSNKELLYTLKPNFFSTDVSITGEHGKIYYIRRKGFWGYAKDLQDANGSILAGFTINLFRKERVRIELATSVKKDEKLMELVTLGAFIINELYRKKGAAGV